MSQEEASPYKSWRNQNDMKNDSDSYLSDYAKSTCFSSTAGNDYDDGIQDSTSSSDIEFEEEPIWPQMDVPGTWGTYGLEKLPWHDQLNPLTKLQKYEHLHLTDEERNGVLTDRIMAAGSSYLDRCPETGKYVICKITLTNKNLRDISLIKYHHYLQFLNLSHNNLTNLQALGQLPFLMYLDVSNNKLEEVLNFKPPFNLTYVNYSYNEVKCLPDLSKFWSIVNLNLSQNYIKQIVGLDKLRFLRYLDMSGNEIEIIENLNNMRLLKLNLEHNKIFHHHIRFSTMDDLIYVNLSHNMLKDLGLFKNSISVQSVDLVCNKIESFMEISHFEGCCKLTLLDLRDNPIVHLDCYVETILVIATRLLVLDGAYLDVEQKVSAMEKLNANQDMIAVITHSKLLTLEQLSHPLIKTPVMLSGLSLVPIVILVGPPGSGKREIIKLVKNKFEDHVQVGVSHTTRLKMEQEVEGEDYYFVHADEFKRLIKIGDFLTVKQILGNFFGLTQQEIYKASMDRRILIMHMDIVGALSLRMRGLCPKLVLAMPKTPQIHKSILEKKYTYTCLTPQSFPTSLYRVSACDETDHNSSIATQILHANTETCSARNFFKPPSDEVASEDVAFEVLENILEIIVRDSKTLGDSKNQENLEINETDVKKDDSFLSKPSLSFFGINSDDCTITSSDKNYVQFDNGEDNYDIVTILMMQKDGKLTQKKNSLCSPDMSDSSARRQSILKKGAKSNKHSETSKKAVQKLSVTFSVTNNYEPGLSLSDMDVESQLPESSTSLLEEKKNLQTSSTEFMKEEVESAVNVESALPPEDLLHLFYGNVLKSRTIHLEKHNSNPGLFCETIFTNEVDASIAKLAKIFKVCAKTQCLKDCSSNEVVKDEAYRLIVEDRLKGLQEELNKTVNI